MVAKSEINDAISFLGSDVCWVPREFEIEKYRENCVSSDGDQLFYWVSPYEWREEGYPLYYHLPSGRVMEFGQLNFDAKLVVRCLAVRKEVEKHCSRGL